MQTAKYHTFIFDLDGTLLYTLADLAAAVNYALRTHQMPERTLDEVRNFVGNGVRMLMIRAIPDGLQNPQFDEVFSTFRSYYMQHSLDTTRPYDGIPQLLSQLKAAGMRTAVVSNKFYAATQELCQHFFPDTVDVAIGEHEAEGIRKKPAPDTVIEALKKLGVSANDAVYIGDSDVDIETARNAGLPCISVLWGFRDKSFLLAHGATRFAATPSDILQVANMGNNNSYLFTYIR
jgi:phosphoglycolate phosphatase